MDNGNFIKSIYDLRELDELAAGDSTIHRLHPLAKLIVTVAFIFFVVSFGRYDIQRLIPFFLYPVALLLLADLPAVPLFKRALAVEPLIIGIGILNPLFDKATASIAGITISAGWLTFFSIFLKSSLAVTSAIILVAVTGMVKLPAALRMLKIPKLFVLQLLLTYRYLTVLMEEVARVLRAYSMRAPMHKGIKSNAWGSLAGQLILRTYDKGGRIYKAMALRGFNGEYSTGTSKKAGNKDFLFVFFWLAFFVLCRIYDVASAIGSLF